MSKYTTEVRFICESYAGKTSSVGYDSIDDVIEDSYEQIFDDYPIFDENYRKALDMKILKHYYTREICEETVGLWKLRLNTRMAEIMPYYNKLYQSELIHFNPLYDVDLTTSHTRVEDTVGNSSSTSADQKNESRIKDDDFQKSFENSKVENNTLRKDTTAENESEKNTSSSNANTVNAQTDNVVDSTVTKNQTDKFSDTPQGGITGLANDTYLTNARILGGEDSTDETTSQTSKSSGTNVYNETGNNTESSSTATNESSSVTGNNSGNESNKNTSSETNNTTGVSNKSDEHNINNTEEYLEHIQGKRGGVSAAKLIMEFRDSFLNIDRMIINDLSDLFFGLWE